MSTPTPRTDAAVKLTFAAGHNTVCPNFAHTLERELTALSVERDELRARAQKAEAELAKYLSACPASPTEEERKRCQQWWAISGKSP